MNLQQLRYFVAISQFGHYGQAAKALYVLIEFNQKARRGARGPVVRASGQKCRTDR